MQGSADMTLDQVRKILIRSGYTEERASRFSATRCWQLHLGGKRLVCVYDSGKVVVQGKRDNDLTNLFRNAEDIDEPQEDVPWDTSPVAPKKQKRVETSKKSQKIPTKVAVAPPKIEKALIYPKNLPREAKEAFRTLIEKYNKMEKTVLSFRLALRELEKSLGE